MTAPTDQASGAKAPDPTPIVTSVDPEGRPQVFLELPQASAPPPDGSGRSGRGRTRSPWWRFGFPALLVVLLVAAPVLVYAGVQVVLKTNDGRLIAGTTNAGAPGWVATVPPTSTMMVAGVSDTGDLSTVDLLALTSPKLGNVIFIPVDTQVTVNGTPETLVEAYKAGGTAALQTATQTLIGAGIDQVVVENSKNWQDLVTPAGSLTFTNPDNVVVNGSMLFPQGSLTLTPDRVGAFLFSRNWAEDDTNRLLRQQDFWQAWMAKIAASHDPGIIPGELDSGVGQFLHTLAQQPVQYNVLPVSVHALATAYAGVFLPLQPQADVVINAAIPFPTAAPPGSRPRTRVLDGTGQLDHGLVAAHNLAVAGAQIDSIGNAESFHDAHTEFIVANQNERAAAQKLRDAFGVGVVVVNGSADDTIDLTVVLGADALGHKAVTDTVLAPATSSTTLPPNVAVPTSD